MVPALPPLHSLTAYCAWADEVDGLGVAAQDPDQILRPASCSKVLTTIVGDQAVRDGVISLSDTLTYRGVDDAGGSGWGLESGDTLTLDQALHHLALYSDNSSCEMVAREVGQAYVDAGQADPTARAPYVRPERIGEGKDAEEYARAEFVWRMNVRAAAAGCENSIFGGPSGLDTNENYTTARDLCRIIVEASRRPYLYGPLGSATYVYELGGPRPRTVDLEARGADPIVEPYYGALMGKGGRTGGAWRCYVYLFDVRGRPGVLATMRAPNGDDQQPLMMADVRALAGALRNTVVTAFTSRSAAERLFAPGEAERFYAEGAAYPPLTALAGAPSALVPAAQAGGVRAASTARPTAAAVAPGAALGAVRAGARVAGRTALAQLLAGAGVVLAPGPPTVPHVRSARTFVVPPVTRRFTVAPHT